MLKKKNIIISITCALALTASLAVGYKYLNTPTTKFMSASWAIDIYNDEEVVEVADNVFIGKVQKQDSNKKIDHITSTQYEVKVEDNIKGNLNGTVKVNQTGGYDGNTLVLYEGDELLQEGQSYLFVTKYDDVSKMHFIVAPTGNILISSEQNQKDLNKRFADVVEKVKNKKK